MKTAIFCDFDGTISRRDVGYSIFHHFSNGKNDELLPDWKSGRMSTRECLTREAEMVRATAEEIYAYVDQFEIDRGFADFTDLCDRSDVPLFITSDGLDFYIRRLLDKHGLHHMHFTANVGLVRNGGIEVSFPTENISCERCGTCKGERIQRFREEAKEPQRVIFVGDGYSDVCATREADVIFAKKDLAQYCLENNISYLEYDTFFDVARLMLDRGFLLEKE
ncbi:MAG: MtnX-like HAD-IB family phosphatase [Thermoplasmata archaeon]|nr:MtnX-like HAD-IB family phosphatase [Thermoplasmata archaeon]